MEEISIQTNDLTKRFGDLVAVDRVSFSVRKGEIFGFLGPNGAGKTTTIRMLCTLSRPTDGSATVAGFDIVNYQPLKWLAFLGCINASGFGAVCLP